MFCELESLLLTTRLVLELAELLLLLELELEEEEDEEEGG